MVSLLSNTDEHLELDMGMSQRDFAKARLLSFLEEEGWLVRGQQLTSWSFDEVQQQGDSITIAGPGFQGVSLHQLLHASGNIQEPGSTNASLTQAPSRSNTASSVMKGS